MTLYGNGRHDPFVLPRAAPMVEAMVALVLVDAQQQQKEQNGLLTCRGTFGQANPSAAPAATAAPAASKLGEKLSGYGRAQLTGHRRPMVSQSQSILPQPFLNSFKPLQLDLKITLRQRCKHTEKLIKEL